MKRKFSKILPSVGALAVFLASPAFAQEAAQDADSSSDEIVVTGTSIRGIAPAGSQPVGLGQEDIAAANAPSTVQLLTQIPQISGFGTLQAVPPVGPRQASNIPTIRGLRSTNAGGSPTLLMVDGRRVAGAGVVQTIGDPDVVSPGAIQRVEVVADGGSAVYGADAVAGVINLITRDSFDGVQFNVNQGFGDEYMSTDANLTIGNDWGSGSAYITYGYSYHDAIYAADRDYVRDISYDATNPATLGLGLRRGCGEGTIRAADGDHVIVGGVPQTAIATPQQVFCDASKFGAIYPEERRDSLFAGFSQDLTDRVTFDLRGYYMLRRDDTRKGLGGGDLQATVAASNIYFPGNPAIPGASQLVYYNNSDLEAFGLDGTSHNELMTWGFSPQFTVDLGHDWQARAFLNYSFARTDAYDRSVSPQALIQYHDQVNFYDLGATDPSVINALLTGPNSNGENWGEDQIVNGRAVFDGPLFTLPAGEVRIALGAEYLGEEFENFQSIVGAASASRRSHGFFAETNIPIVAPSNNVPLVDELSISLAARRDSYSDFDSVTTPRVGITYGMFDWLHFRGTYGQSFQAPSLVNVASAGQSRFFFTTALPVAVFSGFQAPLRGTENLCGTNGNEPCYMAVVDGSVPLEPQRAETFSLGTDIEVPFLDGLEMGLTYWHIDYAGIVDQPPFLNAQFFINPSFASFGQFQAGAYDQGTVNTFLTNAGLTQAQIDNYFSTNPNTENNISVLMDIRTRNLGARRLAGWDGYIRYNHDTSFGSLFFDVNATYYATNKLNALNVQYDANIADDGDTPRWNATAVVGATIGEDWTARATLLYTPSYDRPGGPAAVNGNQSEVEASHPINLNVGYEGFGPDLSLSLGINNVFDEDPPFFAGASPNGLTRGYTGGNLGRVIYLGFDKRF